MDDIKVREYNLLKIKLRNKKNQEEVINQLKIQQNIEELQISVKNCEEGGELLNQISSHFQYLQNLKQLSYNLDNLLNLDICFIFKDLNKFTNLNILSIRLKKNISYQQNHDGFNLGQCLSSLTRLKILKLDLYLLYSSQFQECFQMLQAYQQFKVLKSLQIKLRYLPRNYSTLYEIVDGISNLQSLEDFDFQLGINICGNSGFDKLIEEIFYLVNLKTLFLKLKDCQYFGRNVNRFLQIIKNLQKLEELTLKLPNQVLKQNNFVKELESLSNLKKLNYKSQNLDFQAAQQQLQQISQLKNLDNTKLIIRIESESMQKNQFQIIQDQFQNISNLTKLNLSFPPNSQILLVDLMNFLICLQNNQKLEKIDIKFSLANQEEFYKEEPEQQFQLPLNSLKHFKLMIIQTWNKKDYGRINKLLSIFKSQTQLESFDFYVSRINQLDNFGKIHLGDVLSEMDNLKFLKLDIGQQYFIEKKQIFSDLKRKQKLEKLAIQIMRSYELNGEHLQYLGQSLSYLQNLKELDLNIVGNSLDFDSQGIILFSQGFKQLQQLKTLTLKFNKINLGFPSIYPILLQIHELKKLRYLYFMFRGISTADVQQEILPDIIFPQEIKSISIVLREGKTEFNCIKGLFEGFKSLVNLNILKLQINLKQIELEEIKYIENILANLTALQILELDFAQGSIIYLMNMIKRFYQLEQLTFIDLFTNFEFYYSSLYRSIYQKVLYPEQIKHNIQLTYSYFQQLNKQDQDIFKEIFLNNDIRNFEFEYSVPQKFTDEQAFYLFSNMSLLSNLKILKLKFKNQPQFSLTSFEVIAQALSTLKNLESLNLQIKKLNYYYDFIDLKPIFIQLYSLQQLKDLRFKFIDFSAEEEVLKVMFDAIGNLKNLNNLKLFMFQSFKLENTLNSIKQMFQSLASLKKIYFYLNIDQQNQLNLISFLQSFKHFQMVKQISTVWNSYNQQRILLKIPKLVEIKNIQI